MSLSCRSHRASRAPRLSLAGEAGALLVAAVGRDAELRELQVIVSEPGAAAQDVHSDSNYDAAAPRLVTVFVALHDVLDERMGPTRFWPNTHEPRCFPGGVWRPPTSLARGAEIRLALRARATRCSWTLARGTAAAASGIRRTLLASSFVAPDHDVAVVLRPGCVEVT